MFCTEMPTITKVRKGIEIDIAAHNNAATITTVATIRPTKLYIFFTTKRSSTIPALSSFYLNHCFIYKFH